MIFVEGICGPVHKSIRFPHLYAVTLPPSGILLDINYILNGFYPKSSRASIFVKTNLSNVCLSATIF